MRNLFPWLYGLTIMMAPEDEGGSAAAAGGKGGDDGTAESVLFPNEGGEGGDGKPAGAEGDDDGAGEWKEYEPDPNKSDEENAAAKAEHDKTKPSDDPEADKVPEDGQYQLKMPEGVELDKDLAEALMPDLKEMGLTNGQAQKLVDKYIASQQARIEAQASSPEGAWSAVAHGYFKENGTPDTWADTAKGDKDIGGDKWDGTVQNALSAVDKLGTPELKAYLNASGGGNHPEIIRFMSKVGDLLADDSPATGGDGGKGEPVDAAYTLFPTDAPKKG